MPKAIATHTTPGRFCTLRDVWAGPNWFQILATYEQVTLDVTGHEIDVLGYDRTEHASVRLDLDKALELRDALDYAIEKARAIEHPSQLGLWSVEVA